MVAIKSLLAAFLLVGTAAADYARCTKPFVRREWRTLTVKERLRYIKAQKCLMKKPPQTSSEDVPGVRSRYEDFLGTHIVNADSVHFVASIDSLFDAVQLLTVLGCVLSLSSFSCSYIRARASNVRLEGRSSVLGLDT